MDLTNLEDLKKFLSRYHVRPSEKLGQNFLVDRQVLESIVSAAELGPQDIALEIGAGAGILTVELARRCRHVIAVEKDTKLIRPLKFVLKDFPNTTIINDDILKVNLPEILNPEIENCKPARPAGGLKIGHCPFKVVANIPYYITGEILRQLLQSSVRPQLIVLLVQKEVAERICAVPGKMSILSISVQFFGRPEMMGTVPASAFWPEPQVDSAIVRTSPCEKPLLAVSEQEFFRLVKIGFSARRKTLLNNLSSGFRLPKEKIIEILKRAGIVPSCRAQELSLEEWGKIYQVLFLQIHRN